MPPSWPILIKAYQALNHGIALTITTSTIIAAVVGAGLPTKIALGLVNLFVGGSYRRHGNPRFPTAYLHGG